MIALCRIGAIASALFAAAAQLETLPAPLTVTPLQANTHHVQGIEVSGGKLWVSSVDRATKRGLLFEFPLSGGKPTRAVEVQIGSQFHPGGLAGDAKSLWIPIAEYHRSGTSVVQQRSKQTLEVERQFAVDDHIGCIAVTATHLIGANWDARVLYVWTREGTLVRKLPNPTDNAFQDLKYAGGRIVGGGLLPDRSGAIDWLEYPSLKPTRRIAAGRTDRGVAYTHEGMALLGNRLWLLPEDNPSRLFAFGLRAVLPAPTN